MRHYLFVAGMALVSLNITGCGSGNGAGGPVFVVTNCSSTANDSTMNLDGTGNLINSAPFGIYRIATMARRTSTNSRITQDYMLHEPPVVAKAFLVLIAGGQMNAGITGSNNTTPATAGGNFLVRSAHLFAENGFRVMTIDRPSDYADYLGGNTVNGYAYDGYRISAEHAVDLSELINLENGTNLPVIIAGTSRGAISAVAQHRLSAAIAISSPLTSGNNGSPVTGSDAAQVGEPVYILWHDQDGCSVTTPADAADLVSLFPAAAGKAVDGGFSDSSQANPCRANTYHGFLGIESCAVSFTTDWIDSELVSIPDSRPLATPVVDTTVENTAKNISLSGAATNSAGGDLTYSLPHLSTSLDGSLTINGTTITYTPPVNVSGTTDTFVYVVNEAGGGSSHNLVSVMITPTP